MTDNQHVCPECGRRSLMYSGVNTIAPLPIHDDQVAQGAHPYDVDWKSFTYKCYECGFRGEYSEKSPESDLMADVRQRGRSTFM